jgi:hypothetical protein
MGTDIYVCAEVLRNGRWQLAEPLEENSNWSDEDPDGGPRWEPSNLYRRRNYVLFAVLANVRNATRSIECICEPRGLPDDVSQEVNRWYQRYLGDAYAAGWLSLAELDAFDWAGKRVLCSCFVDPSLAHLFPPDQKGFPEGYRKSEVLGAGDKSPGIEVSWLESYADAIGPEFVIDVRKKLHSFGQPNAVRIVFWFWA